MKADSPNALLGIFLNNHRSRGQYDVTSGSPQDVLIVVPEKPLQDVTWITKSL
jgi:hypothetical protein